MGGTEWRRCAIYIRVSSAVQEDGASLETQEARCRQYAYERGYVVVSLYREVHSGADLSRRQGLSGLREAVRGGAVDVVLAYAVDRLSRNQAHVYILADEVERMGAALEFVTESFEDSAVGKFIRSAKAFAAEVELEKIKERTQRGRLARAQSGSYIPGNRVRYGYRWRDEHKSGLDVEPTTAAIVQRMFAEAAAGSTIRQIAAGLTRDGIPTPTHNPRGWGRSTVAQILSDEIYNGRATAFRRESVRGKDGRQSRRFRPVEEQIALPGGAPALVDPQVFATVRERLRLNQHQAIRNAKHPEVALLRAGYVYCGYCGHSMAVRRGGRNGQLFQYVCKNHNDGFWRCDGRATIAVTALDAAVWAQVANLLSEPGLIAAQLERQVAEDDTPAELARIDRAVAEVERRQRNLIAQLAELDVSSVALAREHLAGLGAQREALESEREGIAKRGQLWQAAKDRLAELEGWCRGVAERLGSLSYDQKRLALEALGLRVKVWRLGHAPRWEITASIPMGSAVVSTSSRR